MLTGDMLRRSAERFPRKTAVIRDAQRLSYRELDHASNRLAQALLALGLPRGAKVAIVSRNLPEYAIAFFGVARSGLVLVNVSVLYAPDELAWVLQKADAQVLLFDALFADKVRQVLPQCPAIAQLVRIDSAESRAGGHACAGGRSMAARSFDDFTAGFADDDPGVALHERRTVLHDLHRWHHRSAQGRAVHPSRPQRHRAHGGRRGGAGRARRGGHRDTDVPCGGAEHHVPAGDAGRRHRHLRHALVAGGSSWPPARATRSPPPSWCRPRPTRWSRMPASMRRRWPAGASCPLPVPRCRTGCRSNCSAGCRI